MAAKVERIKSVTINTNSNESVVFDDISTLSYDMYEEFLEFLNCSNDVKIKNIIQSNTTMQHAFSMLQEENASLRKQLYAVNERFTDIADGELKKQNIIFQDIAYSLRSIAERS